MKFKKFLAVLLIALLSTIVIPDAFCVKANGNYTIEQLQAKYPNGKYWNGGDPESYTSSPCTHHSAGNCKSNGSCGCNSYRGLASQCMGFAYQLASLVYGGNPYSEWTANWNVSALDNVKAGDVVRYNNNGHSIFVTNVSGEIITYVDCNGGGLNNCIIGWNRTKTKSEIKKTFSYVDSAPYEWITNSSNKVTYKTYQEKNTINDTNAILWAQIEKPSDYAVTEIGITVRKDGYSYSDGWSKYEASSWDYVGEQIVLPYFNLNTELGLTLVHSTKYWVQFYAIVNGKEYWSNEYSFITTGSHSYSDWVTVTAPTCTTNGTAKRTCSCGATETKTLAATGHGYYSGYEAAHPHKYYNKCNCGYYYYTGATETIASCSLCYPFEKPIVTIEENEYFILNQFSIHWTNVDKATHYKLEILKKDSNGEYTVNALTENDIKNDYYTISNIFECELPIGEYCVNVYAYDSNNYNDELGDWNYQKSDSVYFKIYTDAIYYHWDFDYELFKEGLIDKTNTSYAEEYTLKSKKIYDEYEIYNEDCKRSGYKFSGWKTIHIPFESFGEIYKTGYGVQAQYEPLLYTKGECLYGDLNFDDKVNVADLVAIKNMVAGTMENHVSADLDGANGTNAIDIINLIKLLLNPVKSKSIYFDANGGTVSETQRLVVCGQSLGKLPIPARTGYDFIGWYKKDGTEVTSDSIMTADKEITAIAHWSAKSYKINWNTGTGYTITVKRTSSPYANATIGTLNNEASIYYGDVLNITYSATAGYSLKSNGITSTTVSSNITSADVYATASVNSYTYNIVYKSSNGTSLGTATAKYNYGTTNTISPKSFTGYNTPSSQSVKWDSTSAKTITFTYSPVSVSTSQNLSSGAWAIDGSTNYITYSVKAEYRNRTASSIQVRVIWTNTLIAYYYYQRGQVFNATIGGKGTGNVTIVPYNTWASSTSSNRSLSGTSAWITVPVSATQTSLSISADAFRQHNDSSLVNINESFSKTFNIPTY